MSAQIETATENIGFFRGTVLVLAFVLVCQSIWMLTAEFSRPPYFGFPSDAKTAEEIAANRDAAALAASFGVLRGDLWVEYSLTYLNLFWSNRQNGAKEQSSEMIEQARDIAERALTLAPHDARGWLTLSSIDLRSNRLDQKGAALQMSYFTGANETELIPLRLQLAIRSDAIADKDFQQLVRHDVRLVVTRKPELKSAIETVYREAPPIGRQFLEETLQDLDPALLTKLRQSG